MTQKELLYFEDAIKHEDNVIKIIDGFLEELENENLICFFKDERSIHEDMKSDLVNMLEVKSCE